MKTLFGIGTQLIFCLSHSHFLISTELVDIAIFITSEQIMSVSHAFKKWPQERVNRTSVEKTLVTYAKYDFFTIVKYYQPH